MPIIVLMRHAHAEMPQPGMRDFDRPLSTGGWADARNTAKQFATTGITISNIFCSPAKRTMETLIAFQEFAKVEGGAILYPSELYSGDVASYREYLSGLSQNDVCMLVGHNPMIEQFAFDIVQTGHDMALSKIKSGYPTAAIAVVRVGSPITAADPNGKLLHFFDPE